MPRLRVTSALSLLGLLIGVAGTQWLCTFTDDWAGPAPRRAPVIAAAGHVSRAHRRSHAPPRVVGALSEGVAPRAVATGETALVPLSTPPDPAPYVRLRGHLDGYVVLDVTTDGGGHVASVDVAQSSGDPVLDAHALATVQRWRFAVPADGAGAHGRLPMRFDSTAPSTPP